MKILDHTDSRQYVRNGNFDWLNCWPGQDGLAEETKTGTRSPSLQSSPQEVKSRRLYQSHYVFESFGSKRYGRRASVLPCGFRAVLALETEP
jgi:hypothetical protein